MYHKSIIKGELIQEKVTLKLTCPRCRKAHPNSKAKPHIYNIYASKSVQPEREFDYLVRCVDCNAVVEVIRTLLEPTI